MFNAGDFLQNRYEIINCIGSGGMADVYKARDHKLTRYVAIKVLKEEFRGDREFVSKFRVEAQAAAGLSHPNIVNVYDVGDENGIYFIVMELVEGITLKLYIQNKGRLSVRETTGIALQVAAGLEVAHNNGIIHRDVKPQNIIISTDGTAKVADFGIARAASSDTINQNVMGSVHYSAPEQSRGGFSDERCDIYSLGITMFEMLTGRVPFDGDSTVEVALKHLQEEIVSPRAYVPDLPRAIEQIILQCTQKKPDRRYQNMSLLIRDLKESLVNPNGDFVRINSEDPGAVTHRYSKEDLKEIKRRSGYPGLFDGEYKERVNYPPEDDDRYDDPYGERGRYSDRRGYGDDRYDDRGHDRDRYDDDDRYNNRYYNDDDDYDGLDDYDSFEDEYRSMAEEDRLLRKNKRSSEGKPERLVTILSAAAAIMAVIFVIFTLLRSSSIISSGKISGNQDESVLNTDIFAELVTVPDLKGMTEDAARQALKELDLGYRYLGETNSSEYSTGLIVSQDLEAGSSVGKNSTVGYIISKGRELTVPDLAGKSDDEAVKALSDLSLQVTVDNTRYSNEIGAGYVITTNPGTGSVVHEGDVVTVYVSQGEDRQSVSVPNVEGKYRDDALTMLNNYNLYVYVASESSETVPEGLVIRQDLKPGSYVQTGSTITITVSTGPSGPLTPNTLPDSNTGSLSTQTDQPARTQDPVWLCYAQLSEPEGFAGENVRITLVQNDITSTVFEGKTSFPYLLKAEGQEGVSEGTAYVYVLDEYGNVKTTTSYSGIIFQQVG